MAKPKPINKKLCWAYFAPDGYLQVRSIAQTKKLAREMVCKFETTSYKDYEKAGYTLHRVLVDVQPIQ